MFRIAQSFRRTAAAALLGLGLLSAHAQAEQPAIVGESLYSPNRAAVSSVIPAPSADVVILDGGLAQGLRLGMVCSVSRGNRSIGELIIIESRKDRSAGLILQLTENASIQAGDVARIKTLQTS